MAASRCTSACYVTFIIFSLFSHLAELIFSAILALTLYRDVIHRDVFFSLTSGLLILPLVLVQLVSAVFLLRRRGDNMSGGQVGQMALLHLLQLGFVWRHLTLLRHNNNSSSSNNNNNNNNSNVSTASTEPRGSRNDLAELLTLRLVFTFVGGFPLVLIHLYLVVNGAGYDLSWPWALYGALSASVVSTTWALASYQRRTTISSQCSSSSCDECSSCASSALSADGSHLLSWPGSLFRILWRGGELVSRVISLTLFASLYHQWVFLVLGLHWLVMLLCLSLPQAFTDHSPRRSSSSFSSSPSCGPKAVWCVVTSYSYVFAYVNTSRARAAVWYTLYYVIMFLENGTLSIVWMTKSVADSFTARYLLVFISTLAFVAAVVCLTVYYKYFHLPATSLMCHHHPHHQDESSKPPGIVISGCCSEDLNPCGNGNGNASACKHHHYPHHNPHHHQRLQPCQNANGVIAATTSSSGPANPTVGWVNQYHSALTAGQYYKHAMHDSLLDSTSDLASMTTGSGIALAGGRPRSRHPKMGLNGPASSSLDSVVGVGLRRGTTTLATQNCCGCCRSDGYGSAGCQDADATSLASCQTSRSVASFPQSQHHHHHHHKHGPHNHNNHNSRRCQLKTCSRSDLTDTTSVLTVASGASHNLGYEGSDETHSNNVPAWLPTGESLIAKHLLSPDSVQGDHIPGAERQDINLENYRRMLRQEAQRWGTETTPTLPTHDTTPRATTLWDRSQQRRGEGEKEDEEDSECFTYCCCQLSPGDSDLSSIFRAAQRSHAQGCQLHKGVNSSTPRDCCADHDGEECTGGGGGDGGKGGDVVYGVPVKEGAPPSSKTQPHHHHHHHRHHHQQHQLHKGNNASSSSEDSELAVCSCCFQKETQLPQGEAGGVVGKRYHIKPHVFTSSDKDGNCSLNAGREPHPHHHHHHQRQNQEGKSKAKKCVSESEGLASHSSSQRHGQGLASQKMNKISHSDSDGLALKSHNPGDCDQTGTAVRSASDSEGLRSRNAKDAERVPSGVYNKSKLSDKRHHGRDHSDGRSPGRGSISSGRSITSSDPARTNFEDQTGGKQFQKSKTAPKSGSELSSLRETGDEQSRAHYLPSKLQVKAIAARSDDDDGPLSARSASSKDSSSEPVYENVSMKIQQEKQTKRQQNGENYSTSVPSLGNGSSMAPSRNTESKDSTTVSDNEPTVYRNLKNQKSNYQTAGTVVSMQSNRDKRNDRLIQHQLTDLTDKKPPKSAHHRNKEYASDVTKTDINDMQLHMKHKNSHSRSPSGGRLDSWYVCSESEDSALPPETFSSSMDGVSDVDSDISFELVI